MKCQRMELTRESIKADIQAYQQRIADARLKFAELPTATNWKERKKVGVTERALTSDIDHVYRCVALAEVKKSPC